MRNLRIRIQATDDSGMLVLAESVITQPEDGPDATWHATRVDSRTVSLRPHVYRLVCQAVGSEMRHVSSVGRRKAKELTS